MLDWADRITPPSADIVASLATMRQCVAKRRVSRPPQVDNSPDTPQTPTTTIVAECSWWGTKRIQCRHKVRQAPLLRIMYGLLTQEHPIIWCCMKIGLENYKSPNYPDMSKQVMTRLIQYVISKTSHLGTTANKPISKTSCMSQLSLEMWS